MLMCVCICLSAYRLTKYLKKYSPNELIFGGNLPSEKSRPGVRLGVEESDIWPNGKRWGKCERSDGRSFMSRLVYLGLYLVKEPR